MNLYCLPCAGASATMYLRWKKMLPKPINVELIEPAGRGSRISDNFIDSFDAQVDDLFTRFFLNNTRIEEDYILFGHSMGALLAYGLVHKISDENMNLPKAIIVSASAAPSARDNEKFERLDDDSLTQELKSYEGTPQALFEYPELLDMTLQCLRADYKTCRSFDYIKKEALSIPIYVFRGRDDEIELKDMQAWQRETLCPITINTFDGGHFYIRPDKSELDLIKRLKEIISYYV